MDIAKEISKHDQNQTPSFFVVTQRQMKGRGRHGRVWSQANTELDCTLPASLNSTPTPEDSQILQKKSFEEIYSSENDFLPFTFVLKSSQLKIPLEWISLMVGAAVYDTFAELIDFIHNLTGLKPNNGHLFLKWPNDIIWKNNLNEYKKLSGILCETHTLSNTNEEFNIYIGIGINFFDCPEIHAAGSFFEQVFSNVQIACNDRLTVLKHASKTLLNNLEKCLFNKEPNLCQIILQRMFPLKTLLSIPQKNLNGRFVGIEEDGALILRSKSGTEHKIYSDSIEIMKPKNLLCVDFGNTRIHITAQNEFQEAEHGHLDYKTLNKKNPVFEHIAKIFHSDFITNINFVYVSVNSTQNTNNTINSILNILSQLLPNKQITLKHITETDIFKNLDIHNNFDQNTLGSDRALKCVYAFHESKKLNQKVIIISFGTAITCEGFNPEGKMIENFVSPGVQMSFDALHHFTALLPKIDAQKIQFKKSPEYWTQEIYLNRGIIFSLISSILLTAKIHNPCQLIFTGGNAQQIKNILLDVIPSDLTQNLKIQVIDNIETKVLTEYHEKFE